VVWLAPVAVTGGRLGGGVVLHGCGVAAAKLAGGSSSSQCCWQWLAVGVERRRGEMFACLTLLID